MPRLTALALFMLFAAAAPAQDAGGPPSLSGTWKITNSDGTPLKDKNGDDVDAEVEYTQVWFTTWEYQVYIIRDGQRIPTKEHGTVEEWFTGLCVWTNSKGGTGTMIWNDKGYYDTTSGTTGDQRRQTKT